MEFSLPVPRRATHRRAGPRAHGGFLLLGRRAGGALAWLAGNRLVLRITVCGLLALMLLGGGWLWLRDSSLVVVRHVHISGVHGADAIEIRTALDGAATQMTTMDFHLGALRSAVAPYVVVGALHVTTSFPHTVSIAVSERPPVAALLSTGQRTAVAADGTVLGPSFLSSSLPTINSSIEPPAGTHVSGAATLGALALLGATPTPIARFVTRVYNGPEGLTVAMRSGLLVYFGDATRPHAKWMSLVRVLTSPSAAGALYIDVRLPERPAAGFSAPSSSSSSSGPSTASASMPVQTGATDPTAAALAARLSEAAGGESTATASPGTGETETSSGSPTDSGSSESKPSQEESEPTKEGSTSTGG